VPRSRLLSAIFAGSLISTAPFLIYWCISLSLSPGNAWGVGWIIGLFIIPGAIVGLCVGVGGYVCWFYVRNSRGWVSPLSSAVTVGISVGLLGALPIGFLVSVTDLKINFPVAALASGLYMALLMGCYVFFWERRESGRGDRGALSSS